MRGGRRPGAGRPSGIPTKPIRVPVPLLSEISRLSHIQEEDIPSLRRELNKVITEGLDSAKQNEDGEILQVSRNELNSVVMKWQTKVQGNKKLKTLFQDFKSLFERE